jgi:hypothetical protein
MTAKKSIDEYVWKKRLKKTGILKNRSSQNNRRGAAKTSQLKFISLRASLDFMQH